MADDGAMGGAIGGFGGSIVGMMMAQGQYDKIAKLREQAMKLYGDISLPSLEKVAKTGLAGVSMDQKYKDTSDQALQQLMGVANAKGMDPQAQEKLLEAKTQALDTQRGMEGSALTGLARRGALNSGAQAQMAISGAQAGADRAYKGNIQAASDDSARGLDALRAGGNMAMEMGQNDLHQKDAAATAQDRINEFNSGLGAKQFGMQMDLAKAKSGQMDTQAGDAATTAARQQSQAAGLGRGAGAIGGGLYDEFGNPKKPAKSADDASWWGDADNGGYAG